MPLFDLARFFVCGKPESERAESVQLWAKDEAGMLAMEAQALLCMTLGTQPLLSITHHSYPLSMKSTDQYQEIRDGVRALCAQYPDEYFRKVDEQRAYPEAFVDALTEAGWLAALIPQEYGGSGLGLAEASVIMEEINRCGGNSGACHGQMYNMGTLRAARLGGAEARVPAEDRQR